MSRELRAFQDALIVRRVLARTLKAEHEAMEHATPEALKQYMQEHPGANPANHHVKGPEQKSEQKPEGKKPPEKKPKSKNEDAEKPFDVHAEVPDEKREADPHQKTPAYKTKRKEGYKPKITPPGWKPTKDVSERLSRLGGEMTSLSKVFDKIPGVVGRDAPKSHAERRLEELLVEGMQSGVSGTPEAISHEYHALKELLEKTNASYNHAESDEEADKHRFSVRKLVAMTRAYENAHKRALDAK